MTILIILAALAALLVFAVLPAFLKMLVVLVLVAAVINVGLRIVGFMANPRRASGAKFDERLANAAGWSLLTTFRENNGWWCMLFTMTVLSLVMGVASLPHRSLVNEIRENYETHRATSETSQEWSNWWHNKGFKADSQLPAAQRPPTYVPIQRNWWDWPWGWAAFWLFVLTVLSLPLALMDEGHVVLVRIAQRMRRRVEAGDISLKNHWWDQVAHRWISSFDRSHGSTTASAPAATHGAGTTAAGAGATVASATIHNVSQSATRGFIVSLLADLVGELLGNLVGKELFAK